MGQMSFQSSPQHDKWAIRVYNGYATYRPLIAIITYADIPRERHNTGIRGIDFSHKLVRDWKNLPIDLQFDFQPYPLLLNNSYFRRVQLRLLS